MTKFFSHLEPTLPLQVREAQPILVGLPSEQRIVDYILSLDQAELLASIPTTIQSLPYGEVDIIYLQPIMAILESGLNIGPALREQATILSTAAHTIMVMRTRDAEASHRDIIEKVLDLTRDKDKPAKPMLTSGLSQGIQSGLSFGGDAESAFMYAGAGLIRRRVNIGTGNASANLDAHLRNQIMPLLRGGFALSSWDKLISSHTLRIYLRAISEYDNGMFTSKLTMTPSGFFQAKAERLWQYAFMFIATALVPTVYELAWTKRRLEMLRKLLESTPLWTPMQEIEWADVISKYDKLKLIHGTLPVAEAEQAVTRFCEFTGVNSILDPRDLDMDQDALNHLHDLGSAPVGPGEASLYMPLAERRRWTLQPQEKAMAHFHGSLKRMRSRLSDVYAAVNAVKTLPDAEAKFRYPFEYAPQPPLFVPRLTTIADEVSIPVGIKRTAPSGEKYLASGINSVMSYRKLLDRIAEENPTVSLYMERSLAKNFLFPDAAIMLPIPDYYLEGEMALRITLSDDTLTRLLRTKGFFETMSFARSVELLMFRSDPQNFGMYAGFLAGAFTVFQTTGLTARKEASRGARHIYRALETLDGKNIGDVLVPILHKIGPSAPEEPHGYNASVSAYGMPAHHLVWANIQAYAKLSSEAILSKVIWSDPAERTFGLLPHIVMPRRAPLHPQFIRLDEETSLLQFYRAELLNGKGGTIEASHDFSPFVTDQFSWTDNVGLLPHMLMSFSAREKATPFARAIAIHGPSIYAYMQDCITTPTLAALNGTPEAWIAAPGAPSPVQVNLDAIMEQAQVAVAAAEANVVKALEPAPAPVVIAKDDPKSTAESALGMTLEETLLPPSAVQQAENEEEIAKKKKKRAEEAASAGDAGTETGT